MNRSSVPAASHGGRRPPWLTCILVAVATGLWLLLGPAPDLLVFDRAAIANGEAWRLVTGHLVHGDGTHALWDIAALAILGMLMEPLGRKQMAAAAAAGMAAVDAALWWWLPELDRYCGLSGMLNALFVVAITGLWKRYRHPVFVVAAMTFGIKLIVEMSADQSLLIATAWPSVPLSHVAGYLGGMVVTTARGLGTRQAGMRFERQSGQA